MNLLVTPAQHLKLKQIAQIYETSLNDLMCNIFDELIEDHKKQLDLIEKHEKQLAQIEKQNS